MRPKTERPRPSERCLRSTIPVFLSHDAGDHPASLPLLLGRPVRDYALVGDAVGRRRLAGVRAQPSSARPGTGGPGSVPAWHLSLLDRRTRRGPDREAAHPADLLRRILDML